MNDEIFERSVEIKAGQGSFIPEKIGSWWKEVSKEAITEAIPGKLYAIGNYLVSLAKNSLGDGKSDGRVTASFDPKQITIVIEDFGNEVREMNLNVGGDFGMKETIDYADDFTIEAGGRLYEKVNTRELVEEVDDSDVCYGSKVTFVKNI